MVYYYYYYYLPELKNKLAILVTQYVVRLLLWSQDFVHRTPAHSSVSGCSRRNHLVSFDYKQPAGFEGSHSKLGDLFVLSQKQTTLLPEPHWPHFSQTLGRGVDPTGDRSYPPWNHPHLPTLWFSLFLKSPFSLFWGGGRRPFSSFQLTPLRNRLIDAVETYSLTRLITQYTGWPKKK